MQLEAISETEEGLYISNTAPEKCYLCGTPEQSLLPFYEDVYKRQDVLLSFFLMVFYSVVLQKR